MTDGTAVSVAQQGEQYPMIPDRAYNDTISELGVRDFSVLPPKESEEKYPLFVPSLDADGNFTLTKALSSSNISGTYYLDTYYLYDDAGNNNGILNPGKIFL